MRSWLNRPASRHVPSQTASDTARAQPTLDVLEDRTTPTVSAITSNFNGTAIPAGDSLWFSSVAKVSNLPASGATLHVTNQTITLTGSGVAETLNVPDTTVILSPNTTSATVTTDTSGDWIVNSPEHFSGNVFLAGLSVPLPNGLPGGIKNVTWSGDFTTDTAGVKVNWQWATAAYTQLAGTDAAALGVKPSDSATAQYPNSDHAGTPENYRHDVVGGARGGGGSNYTGSYSGTASVAPDVSAPVVKLSDISGYVFDNGGAPQYGVHVTLTGKNDLGQSVSLETWTDSTGYYDFAGVRPGTYTITEEPPSESGLQYSGTDSFAGQIAGQGAYGSPSGVTISTVTLNPGDVGTQFDFVNNYTMLG
jgi:hypothetical protein